MNALDTLIRADLGLGQLLQRLGSPLLLALRLYVSWQFLKSGWLKYSGWQTTLGLFRDEYHVPLQEGFEAALGDHILWGLMMVVLLIFGPGRIALDSLLQRRAQ